MYEYLLVEREIEHALQHLKQWMQPVHVDTPFIIGPGVSYILYEPLGVVSILSSWNYPIFTTFGPLISVIAAGNCAIVKPSEISPYCS